MVHQIRENVQIRMGDIPGTAQLYNSLLVVKGAAVALRNISRPPITDGVSYNLRVETGETEPPDRFIQGREKRFGDGI